MNTFEIGQKVKILKKSVGCSTESLMIKLDRKEKPTIGWVAKEIPVHVVRPLPKYLTAPFYAIKYSEKDIFGHYHYHHTDLVPYEEDFITDRDLEL